MQRRCSSLAARRCASERERRIEMHDRTRAKCVATAVAAVACALPFFGLASPAAAHVDPPTVTALHAFIGDPLMGLDSPAGGPFRGPPPRRAPRGGATKPMDPHPTGPSRTASARHLHDP